MWMVNGVATVPPIGDMWRIDDDSDKAGIEFLMNPVALVKDREVAEAIVELHNATGSKVASVEEDSYGDGYAGERM